MGGALVITIDPAWPPVSGADHRNWNNAMALARRGPVTLASAIPVKTLNAQPGGITLAAFPRGDGAPLFGHRPSIAPPLDVEAVRALTRIAEDMMPDVILLEGVGLAPVLPQLRKLTPRLVLDMHNIESDLASQLTRALSWWQIRRRLKGMREEVLVSRLERAALTIVDSIWVCSAEDAARLSPAGSIPVHVVPNGIPNAERAPAELPPMASPGEGPTILFSGHLRYPPNVQAIRRLILGILPRVRETLPEARLIVAGRTPDRRLRPLWSRPGVTLVADPPDTVPLLAGADIVAVPLLSGGGTRLKILEAMAWGVPVVATGRATEGLGLNDGVDFTRGETDDAIADAIVALVREPARRDRQRHAAHETVLARFGPDNIAAAVRAALA